MSIMKGTNLNGNRVQRSDDSSNGHDDSSYQAKRASDKAQQNASTKKALKTTAKGAATAFGTPAAGKAVDMLGKTKLGDKIFNKGAQLLNKIPGIGKTMKKLDDKKLLDAADKAVDIASADPKSGLSPERIQKAKSGVDSASNSSSGGASGTKKSKPSFLDNGNDDDDKSQKPSFFEGIFSGKLAVKMTIFGAVIGVFFIVIFFIGVAQGGGVIASYDEALGVSDATGGETGGIDYSTSDPLAQAFFDRVAEIKNSFQAQGKTFNPVYISAVYIILNQHGADLTYEDMTTAFITEIANSMFSGNSFSEETFRQNLINSIFPKYTSGGNSSTYEVWADEVFEYYDDYFSLIGSTASNCASLGSCVYEIKGFYISGRGNVSQAMTINDLKVRLMECGGSFGSGDWNTPLEGEELVPFEQYVLGVAYQEIGPSAPDEAIKAQMVAARSFSLARPLSMGNANGKKLEQEDGQWILQLSSCVADQVYCNPNLGCSAMNDGEQYGTVRSGIDHGVKFKDPLPADHKMRTLANDTMGEVLVNEQGNIISTNYASVIQNRFIDLANQGLNYKQILLQVYGASNIDKMTCNTGSGDGCNSTGSTGPYSGWKQADPAWGTITIGNTNKTIAGVGCLATSVSMLIAKSGVATTVDGDFNPGTFVQKLNATGGFSGANLIWAAVSNAAPNFVFQTKRTLAGQSQSQKLETIRNLVNQGYYVVVEVKGNTGQHWVAVDGVDGNTILMMDPASQSTNMWSEYNWQNTSELAYFAVTQ